MMPVWVFVVGHVVTIVFITIVGIWAATETERILIVKDPGKVVVDEVAGQLIALLPISWSYIGDAPILYITAFLLFRLFDIVKPYPARKFESLKGGWGIMADDLIAGVYAAVLVVLLVVFMEYREGIWNTVARTM